MVFMVEIQNMGLQILYLGKLNWEHPQSLFCRKFASMSRNIVTFCPPNYYTHDTALRIIVSYFLILNLAQKLSYIKSQI